MVSAVHQQRDGSNRQHGHASKGLHMVSAVHREAKSIPKLMVKASKGLHMVSAVHPLKGYPIPGEAYSFKGAAHG